VRFQEPISLIRLAKGKTLTDTLFLPPIQGREGEGAVSVQNRTKIQLWPKIFVSDPFQIIDLTNIYLNTFYLN
jgi:hypothetical protein